MRRGLKRKLDKILDNFEEEPDPYQQGLGDFQSQARKRESMRIKNQVNISDGSTCTKEMTGQSWEKSLHDQIHVEQKLLEGTAKFINACKNEQQALEGAKRLQLGRLRLEMLRFELGRMKRGRGSPQSQIKSMFNGQKVLARPSFAGVSLSDIRIPLMWKRKDHLNDAGDKRKFSVFCIARIGSQIYDTRLITGVDRSSTDITIDDVILFSRVAPHFELTIELYAKLVEDGTTFPAFNGTSAGASAATAAAGKMLLATPQKICRSISRAVGKKLMETNFFDLDEHPKKSKASSSKSSGSKGDDPYFTNVGPKFDMIASATLTLDDCSNEIKSHEFYVEDISLPSESTSQNLAETSRSHLPLFGHFCSRLASLPYCCEEPVLAGKVYARKMDQDDAANRKTELFWARLMDWKLSLWSDEQEVDEGGQPLMEIPINRDTCILEEANETILVINHEKDEESNQVTSRLRPKSVSFRSSVVLKKMNWQISFVNSNQTKENSDPQSKELSKDEYDSWLVHLLQHAADHRRWKVAATSKMELYSPGATNKKSASSLVHWNIDPPAYQPEARPERDGPFQFPRMSSFNPSSAKRQKREAKKSFRRTRSKLVLLYNETGKE